MQNERDTNSNVTFPPSAKPRVEFELNWGYWNAAYPFVRPIGEDAAGIMSRLDAEIVNASI
jgi:hypothetical protein